MKIQKTYQEEDKMISLIRDNYDLLQSLGSFGIHLGFGDKTVREVCEQEQVDTYTFLTVVNFTINGYRDFDDTDRISLPTLVKYLRASHEYWNVEKPWAACGHNGGRKHNIVNSLYLQAADLERLVRERFARYAVIEEKEPMSES